MEARKLNGLTEKMVEEQYRQALEEYRRKGGKLKDECFNIAAMFEQIRGTTVKDAVRAVEQEMWFVADSSADMIAKFVNEDFYAYNIITKGQRDEMVGQARKLSELMKGKKKEESLRLLEEIDETFVGNMLEQVVECECQKSGKK